MQWTIKRDWISVAAAAVSFLRVGWRQRSSSNDEWEAEGSRNWGFSVSLVSFSPGKRGRGRKSPFILVCLHASNENFRPITRCLRFSSLLLLACWTETKRRDGLDHWTICTTMTKDKVSTCENPLQTCWNENRTWTDVERRWYSMAMLSLRRRHSKFKHPTSFPVEQRSFFLLSDSSLAFLSILWRVHVVPT